MERPILFSAPMVRAILAGTKTQTRRVIKQQPNGAIKKSYLGHPIKCPYGASGTKLWVREPFQFTQGFGDFDFGVHYMATADITGWIDNEGKVSQPVDEKIRPSIFMPRWASRITLEIVNIRVERLQDISEEDARSEGVDAEFEMDLVGFVKGQQLTESNYKLGYKHIWDSINGAGAWNKNPFCWVLTFKRIK
jgi:hypothetical protein